MKRHFAILAATLLALCSLPRQNLFADGMIVIHNPPPVPGSHFAFAPLEIKYHHVTTKINGQVAVTEVDQAFFNPHNQRLEGTYLFPLPRGAQIDKLSMDINGTMMDAELLDADKARGIYEDIVRKMKDPALMEYAGQGLFKLRIFPIEPHSEKRIKIKYTQLLTSENGLVEYLYPLNTEKFSSAPIKEVSVKVELEGKREIKSIYSPSHEVEIKRHNTTSAVVGFETKNAKPDTDFQLFFSLDTKEEIGCHALAYRDPSSQETGAFLLMLSPRPERDAARIIEKDVLFVVDTSGSMADNNKIDQAKKALLFCLKNLNRGDRFDIVRFSTEAEPLFGKLLPVNDNSRDKAAEFITGLKPIGGTAIEEALRKALESANAQTGDNRPCMIVFLTDGKPTIGNTSEDEILASMKKASGNRSTRIFCFGIGADINTHLLDKITEATHAASQYVLPEEDIEIKVSNFYAKINEPVLANPSLQVEGSVKASLLYPSRLPDLFHGEQLVILGRYTGSGSATITLEGMVNGSRRSFTYEMSFPEKSLDNAFIPKLWATRRVGFLLDEIRLHGENKELRDEVTDLARRYGIVTPYTAFLIVEDEARRNVPVISRTLQTFDRDDRLRSETRSMYDGSNHAKSGADAIGASQSMEELKVAKEASAPAKANARFEQGQKKHNAEGNLRVQQALQNQQTRSIANRTFYQNANQWIDASVAGKPDARRVQVKFNSEEYFALLKQDRNTAQWLSVGRNVQLLLNDTVYEIVD